MIGSNSVYPDPMTSFRPPASRCRVVLAIALTLAVVEPARGVPPPFDQPEKVELALTRYFSTGDFFTAYREGAEARAAALGVRLQVFDSGQDAERQEALVDRAIAQGVDGHHPLPPGSPETMRDATRRAVAADVALAKSWRRCSSPTSRNPKAMYAQRDQHLCWHHRRLCLPVGGT